MKGSQFLEYGSVQTGYDHILWCQILLLPPHLFYWITQILMLEGNLVSSLNPTFTNMEMKIPRLWEYFPRRQIIGDYLHMSGWLMNKLKPKHNHRRIYQSLSFQVHGIAPELIFFKSKRDQKMKKTLDVFPKS